MSSGGALSTDARCGHLLTPGKQALVVDARCPLIERGCWTFPLDLIDIRKERRVRSKGRKRLEQKRSVSLIRELVGRERLDGSVAIEKARGSRRTDPTHAGIPVRRIAD